MSEVKYTVVRIADFDLDRWGKPFPAKVASAAEIAKMFDCPLSLAPSQDKGTDR